VSSLSTPPDARNHHHPRAKGWSESEEHEAGEQEQTKGG